MQSINKNNALQNIIEAREELERIENLIKSDEELLGKVFEVYLGHAYHHMNFAWNTRFIKSDRYNNSTDKDFKKWGDFPNNILLPCNYSESND